VRVDKYDCKAATVRPAREDDIPRILELYNQLSIITSQVELSHVTSLEDYRRRFDEISAVPGHQLLVVEHKGQVMGSMVLLIVPNLSHGAHPWAIVENLIVDQKHREQGLGKMLINYGIIQAKDLGCFKIELSSTRNRRKAHQFYRSLGFEPLAYGFRLYF
jgi:GNAT superfamily N-acetyltransferase